LNFANADTINADNGRFWALKCNFRDFSMAVGPPEFIGLFILDGGTITNEER